MHAFEVYYQDSIRVLGKYPLLVAVKWNPSLSSYLLMLWVSPEKANVTHYLGSPLGSAE